MRSELEKMKEENNQLDGLNRRQNLELQDLRYNIYEYAQIKSQIRANTRHKWFVDSFQFGWKSEKLS